MILIQQLVGVEPFDTPATQAAQGERATHQLGECFKKPFVLILSLPKDRNMSGFLLLQRPFLG